jgi:lipopolysaccharide transport system permease protein
MTELLKYGPLAPFLCGWKYRNLILRLSRREVEKRYRGSLLGLLWAVITPIVMLCVFSFVFSCIFKSRWEGTSGAFGEFALNLFAGLITFNIFSECFNRAPGLTMENLSYVKKVVFPVEILPIMALAVALFDAAVSFSVFFIFYLFIYGLPPVTILLLPVVLLPMFLFVMGLAWFLSALGVYIRDLKQITGLLNLILMFMSPIFYSTSAVPERYRGVFRLNPLVTILEQVRMVLFRPVPLDWIHLAIYGAAGWIVFWMGYLWFGSLRKGFADVV